MVNNKNCHLIELITFCITIEVGIRRHTAVEAFQCREVSDFLKIFNKIIALQVQVKVLN